MWVLLFPLAAHAGPLHDVVEGLGKATGTPTTPASSSGGSGGGTDAGNLVGSVLGALLDGDWSAAPTNPALYVPSYGTPPPSSGANMDVFFYAGAQSVVDSGGSLTMEIRATHDRLGLGLRGSTYFEKQMDGSNLRLDLGTLAGQYKLIRDDRFTAWLELGGAYVSTVDDISLVGAVAGLRLEGTVSGHGASEVGAQVGGRFSYLTNDVRAIEMTASVKLSVLLFSYRYLEFNIGPPLHGPEVGVAFTF
jgi:hypothetical protein